MRPCKKPCRKFFRPKYAKIRTNADYFRSPPWYLYGAERNLPFPPPLPRAALQRAGVRLRAGAAAKAFRPKK